MISNNKGITLIELLAVLALLTLILTLATSVHLFGQKQTSNQTSQVENQANVRLAINILTKEIRKVKSPNHVEVSDNNTTLTIIDTKETVYKLENNVITKDGSTLVPAIKNLEFSKVNNKIHIEITSISDKNNQEVTLSTEIYIRE